jgi:hypothetical protein
MEAKNGEPGWDQTNDIFIRSEVLYSTELLALFLKYRLTDSDRRPSGCKPDILPLK